MKPDRGVILVSLWLTAVAYGQAAPPRAVPGSNSSGHTAAEPAEDDPRAHQVQAATVNARTRLKEQIRQTPINRNLSVGDVIDRTRSDDQLTKTVDAAQPVGGPRWTDDDQTCQVRVDLPGHAVADLLSAIQKDHPSEVALKSDDLKRALAVFARREFASVGTAVAAARANQVRCGVGEWTKVPDAERRRAVAEAHGKAIAQVLDSVGPIPLTPDQTIADALKKPAVRDRLTSWLKEQPVTRIEAREGLEVSVTIFAAPKALSGRIKSFVRDAAPNQKGVDWDSVRAAIEAVPPGFSGTATAVLPVVPRTNLATTTLPPQPTEMLNDALQAEATAPKGSSPLQTGRTAEAAAIAKVRAQFLALHVTDTQTLGQAVAADPAMNDAVDRAMRRAKTFHETYNADGSVTVQVQLDPQAAWDDLRSGP
jgi:hypothetical protein